MPLNGVAYAQGMYVAVGQRECEAAIVTSTDGVSWTFDNFPGWGPLRAVTAGDGLFVAVGNSGAIFTSTNGFTWLHQVALPGANISSVAYGNGLFVAGAPDYPASILTSTNGTNWVVAPSPYPSAPSLSLSSIAYGNSLFVGTDSAIWGSTNGIDWEQITPAIDSVQLQGVAYGGGTFSALFNLGLLFNITPRSLLGLSVRPNGMVDLTLTGGWLGQQCRLQAATSLPASDWVDVITYTNQGSVTHVQDPSATNYPRRFYRVAMP